MRTILLDSAPLGLLSAPPSKTDTQACKAWLATLVGGGARVIVPEITDNELRRELVRARKASSVRRLDLLALSTEHLPLTTPLMRLAADLWAQARQAGQPTAGDNTIDADVILAAQALNLGVSDFVIATTNVGHLSRFVPAEDWQTIAP